MQIVAQCRLAEILFAISQNYQDTRQNTLFQFYSVKGGAYCVGSTPNKKYIKQSFKEPDVTRTARQHNNGLPEVNPFNQKNDFKYTNPCP